MRDINHHPKYTQKKIIQEARKESENSNSKVVPITSAPDFESEFEGEKFDPHHRKPRLQRRINYH